LAIGIGILGLIFGVVFSRSLTAPLSRLADAARAIGARNFNRHVKPEGSEEMAEVAIAFNSMVDALAESEQLRRNLVADVAHELRTPLSVLQGNLRAILDDVYPLEKGEIARLYDQSRLLNRLVEELRELSQAEAGQLPLNLTHVDPVSLISDTVADFGPAAEAESVTLTTDLPTTLPPLQADTARLSQVLHNLLANALRHTPAGGTITVSAAPSDKAIHLTIRDTGEGISAEHLPHIFDRFYRGDRARARADGGAGLGLAIVRAIVEAHGGTVSAASSGLAGEGSTFVISLPCPKSPAAASEQWPLHPAAASSD
jgi:two-component system OmpR family sensor kinase/two-component system sensor histidine kinase BaeS